MKTLLTYLLFILTFFYRSIIAQNQFTPISKICGNTPLDAVKNGNYLYVISVGLVIFDFSTPQNPTLVKHLTTLEGMNPYQELVIYENMGYASWGFGGIQKIDFTNPADPSIIGFPMNSSFEYQNIVIKYPFIYAIGKSNENDSLYLQSIDMNNGNISCSVNLTSSFIHNAYEPKRFIIDGDYLYLTMAPHDNINTFTELHIFNIENPNTLIHLSSIDIGQSSGEADVLQMSHWDLVKLHNHVYIAGRFINPKCQIKIVDVSNPYSPEVEANWADASIISYSGDIEEYNGKLLLTDQSGAFNIISIQNDTTLTLCKRITGFVPSYNRTNFFMRRIDNYALLSNLDNYAIFTFDVSDPCNALLVNTIPFAHDWRDLSASGNNSLFASVWNYYQLYSINTESMDNPFISKRTEVFGWGWGIDVKENYAYLAMGASTLPYPNQTGGLFVFNISDPTNPVKRGWSPPESGNHDVQVFMDTNTKLAYVIAGQPNSETESHENHVSKKPGLRIVNAANVDSLIQIGKINFATQCRGIYAEGRFAYIAVSSADSSTIIDTSGVYIVDVSNPAEPFIIGKWIRTQLSKGHTRAVIKKDNFLYVAHGYGVVALDVTTPSSPNFIWEIQLERNQTMDVAINDNLLFVLTRNSLYVFNISDQNNPKLLSSISDQFILPAKHFHIQPPNIYVLSSAGIFIINYNGFTDFEEKELGYSFRLFQNYPNPFNPTTKIEYQIPVDEFVTLKVYDILGREVATLVNEYKLPGTYNAQFSIINNQISSGVYFYRLQAGEFFIQKKMMVIK